MLMSKAANKVKLEMFETPDDIVQQTREMQAAAPYCGLGFKKDRLDPGLHASMIEKLGDLAPRFQAEHPIREVQTIDPNIIPALYFEDHEFNASVSRALRAGHEAWSGMSLMESACYGFRVYQRGCYLYNHVDRTDTHIISSTICVDHRLDSPWPLYLEDIDGNPFRVDMEPGEFVHYEGARLIHGRPWPLDGDYYVGMFVHYRPASFEKHGTEAP
jgi:prolyl 4-hydroxylase